MWREREEPDELASIKPQQSHICTIVCFARPGINLTETILHRQGGSLGSAEMGRRWKSVQVEGKENQESASLFKVSDYLSMMRFATRSFFTNSGSVSPAPDAPARRALANIDSFCLFFHTILLVKILWSDRDRVILFGSAFIPIPASMTS